MPPLVEYDTIDCVQIPYEGRVRLNAHTLTDNSMVYDVCFYNENDVMLFTLKPATLEKAEALFEAIREAI